MIKFLFIEDKSYYDSLSYVNTQPDEPRDIYASIVEENCYNVAREHEWDTEWNQSGLTSRMSEAVCRLFSCLKKR